MAPWQTGYSLPNGRGDTAHNRFESCPDRMASQLNINELRKRYAAVTSDHYHSLPPIVQQLAESIAPFFRISAADIFIPRRVRNIVDARQVLQFALVRGCGMQLTETGRLTVVGGADHTTVLHGCNVIGHVSRTVDHVAAALNHAIGIARKHYSAQRYPCPAVTGLHARATAA